MSAFRFRLDRVLRLRERAEREQARALGEALREEAAREAEARAAAERLARAAEQIGAADGHELPAGALANLRLARGAAEEQVDAARERVDEAGRQVDEERERWHEKRRDVRTLEKLREHRHEEWKLDETRREQKQSDDQTSSRPRRGERS